MSNVHQRENTEPTEKDHAIPVSMWVVVGILTLWGIGFYVMSADDAPAPSTQALVGDTSNTQTPVTPQKAAVKAAASGEASLGETGEPAGTAMAALDGSSIYAAQCQACHQADGAGLPGVFPPLKDTQWVKGDPQVLLGIILAGYSGPLDVLGQTYNGAMPAFGGSLSNAEIAAVTTYLRTNFNKESAIDVDLVAAVRSRMPDSPFSSMDSLSQFAKP